MNPGDKVLVQARGELLPMPHIVRHVWDADHPLGPPPQATVDELANFLASDVDVDCVVTLSGGRCLLHERGSSEWFDARGRRFSIANNLAFSQGAP